MTFFIIPEELLKISNKYETNKLIIKPGLILTKIKYKREKTIDN